MLSAEHLTRTFPGSGGGLFDVSFTIRRGEFLVIAGKNGSGKTVLMKHLNGLLAPTSGRVLLEGKPVLKDLARTRRKIGLVFQNPDSQILGQTVEDDVAFGPRNLNLENDEVTRRVDEALAETSLDSHKDRLPYTLSGGEKQRCAIAGVLAMKSDIIVFDEPFTQLDFPGVRSILERIIGLHQKGKTIIVITHDLEKVLAHATRLLILERGRLVFDGLPEEGIGVAVSRGVHRPSCRCLSIEEYTWLG
ncbi:MAG: ABC transporter ATP-binding protein [Spirochaetales bacterium]|nr:ABC transporter ATP-binding protein [Spirochaetales bacterium]